MKRTANSYDSRQLPVLMRRSLSGRTFERPQVVIERTEAPVLQADRSTVPMILSRDAYVSRLTYALRGRPAKKRKLALLIPAYNEEDVLAHTIQSAIDAGLSRQDIFVADDCSSDRTSAIAKEMVGPYNVITLGRSGKGLAIHRAASTLALTRRYKWIHIADADGEFDSRYFTVLRRDLRIKYVAATGYVTSLPGSIIGQYRVFEYTLGMEIIRRFQSMANVITIIPGPTSCFRADVFDKLNFHANALCEDFDVTLQIHRQKLGRIQFLPEAVSRTQDPSTFNDFLKQITRWNRGIMQMLFKHKIGRKASKVDAYLTYQVGTNLMFFMMYCIWVPVITLLTGNLAFFALAWLSDLLITFSFTFFAAQRTRRWDILGAFPIVYALRWVSLFIFIKSFVEVALLGKYRLTSGVWETVTRRATAA